MSYVRTISKASNSREPAEKKDSSVLYLVGSGSFLFFLPRLADFGAAFEGLGFDGCD